MILGLILAGGESLRMGGGDKSLLRLGGVALIEHVARSLAPQLDRIAISANGDPSRFAWLDRPVLADALPGLGPLGGLLRGLAWAESQAASALLTAPADTPFLPDDLALRLQPAPSVAASAGRVHHAVALWPVGCRASLAEHLSRSGGRSIRSFAATLGVCEVAFATGRFDRFLNINTPDDLAAAEACLGQGWTGAWRSGPPAG